jgi:hypothetical protein
MIATPVQYAYTHTHTEGENKLIHIALYYNPM